MLTRCFFCHRALPPNTVLEHFPIGSRVAFDPWRGRLWAVCPHCGRWLLAPFDERWEALEELERRTREGGRVLARTDNVSLVRIGPLQVVRVGEVELREEAWWRYGETLLGRARKAQRIARFGKFFDGMLMLAIANVPYWGWSRPDKWIDRARRHTFGKRAWRAPLTCMRCGDVLQALDFIDRDLMRIVPADDGGVDVLRGCARCRTGAAGFRVTGGAGDHLLRRLLAYQNFAGGTHQTIARASALVSDSTSAMDFVRTVAAGRPAVGRLLPDQALALEIAAHEARERVLLQQELGALELLWREEERIAAIADGELTDQAPLSNPDRF